MNEHSASPAYFVTTAIPYVNSRPHVGFAMELVLADVLARYHRLRGHDVRFQTGSDENSLKNVQAAEVEGIATADLVERNARAFRDLRETLDLSYDDFMRTSADPRHRAGIEKLWKACAARGDIDSRPYEGLYCVGCEQFYDEEDLPDGLCPEHRSRPERVEEENYFFALSRYQDQILELLESGRLRVVPEHYRNEVLAFVRRGLQDFSISRSSRRAHGWGIPVPGDPGQVMYVWFDALANYITGLDYRDDGALLQRYWGSSGQRVHVLGKGITRFHAVYWPAMLLSAGLELPSVIAVHGYLTVQGQKIGKSLGNAIDPEAVVAAYGSDVVRYFLCRHVRTGRDGDFSPERLVAARNGELADQLGNLLSRTVRMIERYYDGRVPASDPAKSPLLDKSVDVAAQVESAMAEVRLDEALDAAWSLVEAANKHAVEEAPWQLAKRRLEPGAEQRLATTLYDLAEALRLAAVYLEPFIPRAAAQIRQQLGLPGGAGGSWSSTARWGGLEPGTAVVPGPPLFPKT